MVENYNFYIIKKNAYFNGKRFYRKINLLSNLKIRRYFVVLLFLIYLFLSTYEIEIKNVISMIFTKKIYFDSFEINKYKDINQKLIEKNCSGMWDNQKEFLNGIIRKFKPSKVVEIGVSRGGSSIIILNAIEDFKNSILFSIDVSTEKEIGECVPKYFPHLMKKWITFKGKITTEYIEQIGHKIDMVIIDTTHFEPGEILDFLIVLPFLKENAIVIFQGIASQITRATERNEWAPYIIFNGIRGEKYFPSGNSTLTKDIGAVKLEKYQKRYYHEYFRLLGGQWQYFPPELHINQIRNYFKKYYDQECLQMLEESINFNREFVKKNPKKLTPSL